MSTAAVYRSVREKQGNVVYRQRVLQTVTSLRVVSLVFRGHDLPKITNINPQLEASLSLWKKLVPRESVASWSTPKRRFAYITCVWSHTSREIKNATISEFSSKSREQFATPVDLLLLKILFVSAKKARAREREITM